MGEVARLPVKHVLSPVDYEAWGKGYMPPSEHVLIDKLQYRDARIVFSSNVGETEYWLVMRGPGPKRTAGTRDHEIDRDDPRRGL